MRSIAPACRKIKFKSYVEETKGLDNVSACVILFVLNKRGFKYLQTCSMESMVWYRVVLGKCVKGCDLVLMSPGGRGYPPQRHSVEQALHDGGMAGTGERNVRSTLLGGTRNHRQHSLQLVHPGYLDA